MKKIVFLTLLSLGLLSFSAIAQDVVFHGKNDTLKVATIEYDGERIPWLAINEVFISDWRIFKTPLERAKYNRLRYNVLKVLPYARFAGERYRRLERDLALTSNKKEQKRLVKDCEKEIKTLFNKEVKNLTISQGKILIKLVYRETGNSSYELLKDMQGGFKAFFFQSVAKVFGHDLKHQYDPMEERDIESIIRSAGYYSYQ